MSVPTYDQFIEPILRYLAATPEGATARDAHEAAGDALNLSEAQRQGQARRVYHHLRLYSPGNRLFSFGGRHGAGRRQPTGQPDDGSRGWCNFTPA